VFLSMELQIRPVGTATNKRKKRQQVARRVPRSTVLQGHCDFKLPNRSVPLPSVYVEHVTSLISLSWFYRCTWTMEHTLSLLVGAWSWFLSSLLGFGGTKCYSGSPEISERGSVGRREKSYHCGACPKSQEPTRNETF
jgi:hypothetical protein